MNPHTRYVLPDCRQSHLLRDELLLPHGAVAENIIFVSPSQPSHPVQRLLDGHVEGLSAYVAGDQNDAWLFPVLALDHGCLVLCTDLLQALRDHAFIQSAAQELWYGHGYFRGVWKAGNRNVYFPQSYLGVITNSGLTRLKRRSEGFQFDPGVFHSDQIGPFEMTAVQETGLRKVQQDRWAVRTYSHFSVALVGDGNGENGHIVSEKALEFFLKFLPADQDIFSLSAREFETCLQNVLDQTEAKLKEYFAQTGHADKSGTTLTAVLFSKDGTRYGTLHVGDSRLYRYDEVDTNGQPLQALTQDHHWPRDNDKYFEGRTLRVARVLGMFQLKEFRQQQEPHKTPLTAKADITGPLPLESRVRFLLCSDGLRDHESQGIPDERIAQNYAQGGSSEDIARSLYRRSALGALDNLTYIVFTPIESLD